MKKSPFVHNEPVSPPIFAGRSKELMLMNKAVFDEGESFILFGNDAIGKSSIVKTLHRKILSSKNREILPVHISAFDFVRAVESDFLALATHRICTTIWTKLMNKSYSELIEETFFSAKSDLRSPEEKTLKRIYKIVTSVNLTSKGSLNREIGGKFILEGKYNESAEISNSRKPLESFEFLQLLDELKDIIKSYGFRSIVVFCDELNHLPENVNSNILRNYFDVFSSRLIQFVIVSVNPEDLYKADSKKLIDSFNYSLEIKPFQNVSDVNELLMNAIFKEQMTIEKGVSDFLFEFTGGHPWWIQQICDHSFVRGVTNKLEEYKLNDVQQSAKAFEQQISLYNEMIKAGKPFRKFHLRNLLKK